MTPKEKPTMFETPFEKLTKDQFDFLSRKRLQGERSYCIVCGGRLLAKVCFLLPVRFKSGSERVYCYLAVRHPKKGEIIRAVGDAAGYGYSRSDAALEEAARKCGVPLDENAHVDRRAFIQIVADWHAVSLEDILVVKYLD